MQNKYILFARANTACSTEKLWKMNTGNQRIYISDRTHSIPLRLPNMCLTQPLPALSVVYIEYTTPTT